MRPAPAASPGLRPCTPTPQMPQSSAVPSFISRSWYIAWCARWNPPTPKWTTPGRDEVTVVGRHRQPVAPVRQRPRVERLRPGSKPQGARPSPGGTRRRHPAGRGTLPVARGWRLAPSVRATTGSPPSGRRTCSRASAPSSSTSSTSPPQLPGAVGQVQVLGPDADDKLAEACLPGRGPDRGRQGERSCRQPGAAVGERDGPQVHRGRADEPGDELVHRVVIELARGGALLQLPAASTATRWPMVIASTWSWVT